MATTEREHFLDVEHRCPRCGHSWVGRPKPPPINQGSLFETPAEAPPELTPAPESPPEPAPTPEGRNGDGEARTGSYQLGLGAIVPKPPFRVPTMTEIAATAPNGLRMISTFSGCGGGCLGFKMAGWRILWANEFVPAARETYEANFPGTPVSAADIRDEDPLAVLAGLGLAPGDLDLLEGSPPCSSFSTSGRRAEGWDEAKLYSDGIKQRTDDLFAQYVRFLRVTRPRAFVAENVSGLELGESRSVLREILAELRDAGYRADYRILNAVHFGVPQTRRRMIFVGFRDDVGLDPVFPSRTTPDAYTIRDAIPWVEGGPDAPDDDDLAAANIERFAIYQEWRKLGRGESSERYFNLVRPDPDKPCPTITQTGGSPGAAAVTHPFEPRKFTPAEAKRLCSFPDDFVLTGSYSQRYERLGRAVPPLLMKAVAEAVRDALLACGRS